MERHSEGCQGAKLTRPGYKRAAEINTAIVYGAAALWCSPVITQRLVRLVSCLVSLFPVLLRSPALLLDPDFLS